MRRLAATRYEQLAQIVRAKAAVHPELRQPLDWSGFLRVCDRENVLVVLADTVRPASLFAIDGQWVIIVEKEGVRQLHPGAHELGHLWAHVDQGPLGREELTYHMDTAWPDDPREEEADHIAMLLLMGPASR